MRLTRRSIVRSFSLLPIAWTTSLFGEPNGRNNYNETATLQALEPGDWVEGTPKWWWKYVFPAPDALWNAVSQASVLGPLPDPWRQQIGAILQAAVMLKASAGVRDRAAGAKLRNEAINSINGAVKQLETGKSTK